MTKILFAHSDPKLLELYSSRLSDYFSVDSAADGLSALRKLKLAMPSLVVSDFDLPLLSGLSLLKFVRAQRTFTSTPFIFLANIKSVPWALSFGANDWLQQSEASPDLLIERIYSQIKLNRNGIQIY